jgi:hypothetical protein
MLDRFLLSHGRWSTHLQPGNNPCVLVVYASLLLLPDLWEHKKQIVLVYSHMAGDMLL